MNVDQKKRLLNVLSLFITASRKAFPGSHMGSRDGSMQSVEEYADDTLRLFGVPPDEARFVLTPEEQKEREVKREADRKEQRRADDKRRREAKKRRAAIAALKLKKPARRAKESADE